MNDASTNQPANAECVLACDVGNSRTKFGLFRRSANGLPEGLFSAVYASFNAVQWSELREWSSGIDTSETRGVLAGTHPGGLETIAVEWNHHLGKQPAVLRQSDLQSVLAVDVDQPERVGIDRLLNAVAANTIRGTGEPMIVVDSGTATTVDFVDHNGAFAGGAILPGFELSARSLHEYTTLLPYLGIEQLAANTPPALGRDTEAAIHSGLYWGQIGAVARVIEELDGAKNTPIVVTGGGAGILAEHLPQARRQRHLTLQGLVLAALAVGDIQ